MLKGYCDAYKVFGEKEFLQRALKCADFLKTQMVQPDFSIMRNYKNGRVTINGFLDDYSFTCEALLALYSVTFNEEWLTLAKHITEYVIQHFYNVNTGMFFYTSINDEPLIARKTEMSDNVIPASNSSMAKVLFELGAICHNKDYTGKSKRALQSILDNINGYPSYYANWAMLLDKFTDVPFEVAIVGEKSIELKQEFDKYFLPNCIIINSSTPSVLPLLEGKHKAGETLIYICKNKICQLPVRSVEEALVQIQAKYLLCKKERPV